jgi:hypothetical protein
LGIALLDKILGKTKRQRERRKRFAKQSVAWLFVAAVVLFVVMLIGQFVNRNWINPPVNSQRERTDLLVKKGERIQLTVLNGSGESNVARRFTDFLRARKFDVVEMSNYKEKNVEHSFVIDKVNDRAASEKVAYALGIDPTSIVKQIDTDAFVDAAVVIGKDFPALKPMK